MATNIKPYQFEPIKKNPEGSQQEDLVKEQIVNRKGHTEWCTCGKCCVMPTEEESVCCREIENMSEKLTKRRTHDGQECITELNGFRAVCLDIDVLDTAYAQYRQEHGKMEGCAAEKYRYTAYRQLVRWTFGRLGRSIRVPLPACAVRCIRDTFESEHYTGFEFADVE